MSKTIDERVVEMRFDNKQFEDGVKTSMSSIDKLKEKLSFKGATKGLEEVGSATKNVNMSSLGTAVETVQAKFSALQVIGVTALANITNSAVNAGKRIISALTIDPIKTGFQEYETKMNAIQTIMSNTSSKGTTMEDVIKVIDELNTYADKTIYNFAEMTRNIGTFTAAGVGLEESASAIQGIANLAAASGSSSQQASTAMYQLSQALASGTVKLMDWNSVVNAGMGGQKFQDALKATAKDHGIAVEDLEKKYGSFRETLQTGWLSADILNETLSKFTVDGAKKYAKSMMESGKWTQEQADALVKEAQAMEDAATKVKTFTQLWDTLKESVQSGWGKTWEILIGDFEEAKETLTKISDVLGKVIGESADARNELLQEWKDLGGRKDLVDSLFNIIEAIGSIVKPIKEAFRDIFPATTAKQLKSITENIKEFTANLKLNEDTSDKLKRTFKGLFAVLDIGVQFVGAAVSAIASLFGITTDLGGGILSVTAKLGDFLVKIRNTIVSSQIFNKVFNGIAAVIKVVYGLFRKLFGAINDKFVSPGMEFFHDFLLRVKERMSGVAESAVDMKDRTVKAFESIAETIEESGFYKVLTKLWNGIKTIVGVIWSGLKSIGGSILNTLGNLKFNDVLDFMNALLAGGLGIGLIKFLKTARESISGIAGSFMDLFDGALSMFEGVSSILDGVRGALEAWQSKLKADTLMTIAKAIALLTAAILVLSMIDSEKLGTALGAMSMLFMELMVALSVYTIISKKYSKVMKANASMLAMATAILILSSALKQIAGLEFTDVITGLIGIAGLMAIVLAAVKVLGESAKDGGKMMKGAGQLILLAAAIKIMASACKDMARLDWEEMARSLLGIGVLMGTVSVFLNNTNFAGKDDKVISTGMSMILIASAMKILASACKDFGRMDWDEVAKSLVSVAVLMAGFAQFTRVIGDTKGLISAGISLIAIAASMKIFASATKDFASMSWEDIAKGLTSMGISLFIVVGAINSVPTEGILKTAAAMLIMATSMLVLSNAIVKMGGMSWTEIAKGLLVMTVALAELVTALHLMKGTLGGSASLMVAAMALGMLAPIIVLFGAMSWKTIAKGLITIAGAFAIIGVAGYLLAPIIPAILGLAAALTLIGVGTLALGAALLAAGLGLSALAVGITAIAGSLGIAVEVIMNLVIALIVGLVRGIGEGIIALCEVIAGSAEAIAKALIAVVLAICDVLVECVGPIVDTLLIIVLEILEGLAKYTPQIVVAAIDVVMGIFKGVVEALKRIDPKILMEGVVGLGLITAIIAALGAIAPLIPSAMVGVLGVAAVIAELMLVVAAIGALAQIPGLDWLIEDGGELLRILGNAIGKFIGGFAGGIVEGATASAPQIASDLSQFMMNLQPFIKGVKQIDETMLEGVKSLVGMMKAIPKMDVFDAYELVVFGQNLAGFGPYLSEYANSVSGIDTETIKKSAEAAKALAEMANTIPNEKGMVAWFTGDNSLARFSEEIVLLGKSLKGFSDSVSGISSEGITAAIDSAKALAQMTHEIPNSEGMVTWVTGDNSVAKFSKEIVKLGEGLKGFSDSIAGVNPENITAAANSAKALAEMTQEIPDSDGMVTWFTGDNSVANFAFDIVKLGEGLKGFSDATAGIVAENIVAAADAAKALAEMSEVIPNQGGMVAWFTGDNTLAKFAPQLPVLGAGLKGFSDSVAGIVPENVVAAANAAKTLAEMTETIPNEGGMVMWFTGDNTLANFAPQLPILGKGLKGFSDATAGIATETVTAAANAAKTLAEMMEYIPNEGGMAAWFTGEKSVSKFTGDMISLGYGLKGFSESSAGINPEFVTAAANAAKTLAEMMEYVPNEGGIVAWFTGEQSLSKFGDELPALGEGLKGFSDSVAGIAPEAVTSAANAAKSLAEMTTTLPENTDTMIVFGEDLEDFGGSLKSYFSKIEKISGESITASNNAINSAKKAEGLDSGKIKSASKAIEELIDSLKNMSKIKSNVASNFSKAMRELGKEGINALIDAFKNSESKIKKAAREAVEAFIDGIESKATAAEKACKQLVKDCAEAMSDQSRSFKNAGKDCAKGFANGVKAGKSTAIDAAVAMAEEALEAVKDALGINSPSKEFYKDGAFAGQGFVNALSDYASEAYDTSYDMAKSAKSGLSDAISKVRNAINGDMDMQPRVRPVVDLSDVKSGVSAMSNLLDIGSVVGISSNIGGLNAAINRRLQNGSNGDVVSAIDKLRKGLDNVGNTNNYINGVSVEDEGVEYAIRTIVRAARVERRT